MQRAAIVILFCPAIATAQTNPRIERWFEGAPRADIRWSTHASPPTLSRFQRLTSRLSIRVNGGEIERRRGNTTLMMMVKLQDAAGKSYTTRRFIDLRQPPYTSAKHLDFTEWSATAFLLPGDYELMFAMADLNSREHNLAKKKLHVGPLSGDPIPGAWRDVPPVEFIESLEPPDSWFVPEATGRLSLPVISKRRVRLDVVLNTALSETSRQVQRRPQQSLASLIAALKVLAQLDVRDGRLNIALLDVARRKTVFEQNSVTELDWPRLKTAIASNNPQTIDVGALKDRDQDVQFFLHQLLSRIVPHEPPSSELRVVIVLSPPMAFPPGVDRTPIEPPANTDYRVYYIRYQTFIGSFGAAAQIQPITPASMGRSANAEPVLAPRSPSDLALPRASFPGLPDQLAQTVKPLHSRLFDVFNPNDFRNAIAAILREISEIN
jgi:hypothetical protein